MASNVFPMLSSSPPPIEDCADEEDDEDEEFGNFASANIPFDSSFDSPVSGEKYKSYKTGDNGVNDINLKTNLKELNQCCNSERNSPPSFVHSFSPIRRNSENDVSCNKSFDEPFPNNSITEGGCCFEEKKSSFDDDNSIETSQNSVLEGNHLCKHIETATNKEADVSDESSSNNSLENINKSEPKTVINSDFPQNSCSSNAKTNSENLPNCRIDEDLENTCDTVNDAKAFCSAELERNDIVHRHSLQENDACFETETFHEDFKSNCCISEEFSSHLSESLSVVLPSSNKCNESNNDCFYPDLKDFQRTDNVINEPNTDNLDNYQCHEISNHFDDKNKTVLKKSENFSSSCDHFQEFQNSTSVGEECFAEFQDFKEDCSAESDDFANFEAAPYQENKPLEQSESCEFADFEAVPFQESKLLEQSESSEFADFEGASFCSTSERRESASSIASSGIQPQEKSIDKLSTVINAIFPVLNEDYTISDELSAEILEQSNKSRRLWEKLHEVEPTPSIRFQWGVSQSFQQLLRSVNVDYHSILRTSSVPIFASSLSLLEPVKGLSNSANQESEDRNQSPRDPIPPVEFDWNSSGLINPLDSGQAGLTLMDLSFLSSADSQVTISSGDHSFENEFLKPIPTLSISENSNKTQILEQLLSKNISSLPNSQTTHRPSNLSREAIRALDQLPDLSFMQANVLMFPISSNT